MASPYGQPQPGYGQPGYAPLDGGYPAPYAPYNGPASAYQPGAPQQGKLLPLNKFELVTSENDTPGQWGCSSSAHRAINLGVSFYLLPAM